ncbi:MAG: class B sortase [Clostridia bacterium]|nr:class B sortase [Clostridia bacterium]
MKKNKKLKENLHESEQAEKLSASELENFENILSAYADDEPSAEAVTEEGDVDVTPAADTEGDAVPPSDTEDSSDESGEKDTKTEKKNKKRAKDSPSLTPFEESIRDFKSEDAAPKKKKFNFSGLIRLAVLLICGTVCAVSTVTLVRNVSDKIRGEKIYGEIIDNFADGFNFDGNIKNDGGKIDLLAVDIHAPYTPTMDEMIKNGTTENSTPSDYSAELARMRASLESLRNINPDIYGWIKVPGTKINYPIAQTTNNEYYLDHAYTGDNLVNGSIFADFRCNAVPTMNYNTVLYGHNITDGSMFNHVTKFYDEEFFNNTLIYLYTFSGIYVFKPFSIHQADYDSGYIAMGFTPESFVEFATRLKGESEVASDKTFTKNDRIITLSTCTNGIRTKRNALHGYLIQKITD